MNEAKTIEYSAAESCIIDGRSVWWTACWSASCEGFGVAYEFEVVSTELCG